MNNLPKKKSPHGRPQRYRKMVRTEPTADYVAFAEPEHQLHSNSGIMLTLLMFRCFIGNSMVDDKQDTK